MNFIKRLFCRHQWKYKYGIYGDNIIHSGGKRSVWECVECEKRVSANVFMDNREYTYFPPTEWLPVQIVNVCSERKMKEMRFWVKGMFIISGLQFYFNHIGIAVFGALLTLSMYHLYRRALNQRRLLSPNDFDKLSQ